MTDLTTSEYKQKVYLSLKKRNRAEARYKVYGVAAITFGLMCVFLLFFDITSKGYKAFQITYINLNVTYDEDILGVNDTSNASQMALGDFDGVVKAGLRNRFTEVTGRKNKQELYSIISSGAGYTIRDQLKETPSLLNSTVNLWLIADDDVDTYFKSLDDKNGPFRGRISENKESWLNSLIESGKVKTRFNSNFFSNGDSREPELAGIRGAAMGSFYTLLITIALAFPLGVAAAVYAVMWRCR